MSTSFLRWLPPFALCALTGCLNLPAPVHEAAVQDAAEFAGDAAPASATWPKPGTVFAPGICSSAPPTVDGQFTGWHGAEHEWSCAPSVAGLYGRLYLRQSGNGLYGINDWRLRDDLPVCPGMYNEFWLSVPGQGEWNLRVYGDQHVQVTLDGKAMQGVGATGWGPSPSLAKPHAMFEFRIDAPADRPWPVTTMTVKESDPGVSSFLGYSGSGTPTCAQQVAPMVKEPTVILATLASCASSGVAGMAVGAQ